jgi:hypothetical protein
MYPYTLFAEMYECFYRFCAHLRLLLFFFNSCTVDELNADVQVHGILVQLPLPPHINEQRVLERIEVHKDVDG